MRSKSRSRAFPALGAIGEEFRRGLNLPVRVPIAIVFGCVAAALFVARCFLAPNGIIAGFFLACLAATLPISVWFPMLATIVFLLLLTVLEIAGTYAELLVLLGFPLLGSLAAQRNLWWCVAYSVAFSALGFYSIDKQKFSTDPYAIATHVTLLGIAFTCGWWLKTVLKRRYVKRTKVQRERDELAILTHNTVAAELTSLVVRLEVLAMENPQLKKQLEASADSARRTISDVRVLIDSMRSTTFSSPKAPAKQPDNALKTIDLTLRAHGFHTKFDAALAPVLMGDEFCRVLNDCLLEITTNILKYGDRSSAIRIQSRVERNTLGVRIENGVSSTPERSQSSRMGLAIMGRRLNALYGSLSIRESDETWETEISIPLIESGERL